VLEPGTPGLKPVTVIVGAGVSGLSTALSLLRRGHAVTLLERGTVGSESSWAGGGILSPLLPWEYDEAVAALALRSMAGYEAWVAGIEAISGRDAEFWRCGMLALDIAVPEQALAWCAAMGWGRNSVVRLGLPPSPPKALVATLSGCLRWPRCATRVWWQRCAQRWNSWVERSMRIARPPGCSRRANA